MDSAARAGPTVESCALSMKVLCARFYSWRSARPVFEKLFYSTVVVMASFNRQTSAVGQNIPLELHTFSKQGDLKVKRLAKIV